MKPNQIILWIDSSEFGNEFKCPHHLRHLISRGLEVKFCENIKSHKKYFYAMKNNPDAVIVTLDDDVYYPRYTIERLVSAYKKNPDCICCNMARYIHLHEGKLTPYNTWSLADKKIPEKSLNFVPIGVGGVLYPPGSLSKKAFDLKKIYSLCLYADDLWLKVMSLLEKTEIYYAGEFPKLFCVGGSQKENLGKMNCIHSMNDTQLQNIIKDFPLALKRLYYQ